MWRCVSSCQEIKILNTIAAIQPMHQKGGHQLLSALSECRFALNLQWVCISFNRVMGCILNTQLPIWFISRYGISKQSRQRERELGNIWFYNQFCFSLAQTDWRIVTVCLSSRVINRNISWLHQPNEFRRLFSLSFFILFFFSKSLPSKKRKKQLVKAASLHFWFGPRAAL